MAADETETREVAAYEAGEIFGITGLSERDFVDLLAPLVDCVPFDLLLHCFRLLSGFFTEAPAPVTLSKVKPWVPGKK